MKYVQTNSGLTDSIFDLKSSNEDAYMSVKRGFEAIFLNAKIKVEKSDTATIMWVEEDNMRFKLEDAASGHLAVAYILYAALSDQNRIITVDEPEVHLHPTRIRQLGNVLADMSTSGSQMVIISHSPELIDARMFDPSFHRRLIVVRKTSAGSVTYLPNTPSLKPHMLNPNVFFGNASFLVAGPTDEFVVRAISDYMDGLFDKYGIVIVNCGGHHGFKPHIETLKAYSLPYYGLADREYTKGDSKITVLDKNMEDELQKMGQPSWKSKPTSYEAYRFIMSTVNTTDELQRMLKTKVWDSINNMLEDLGVSLDPEGIFHP